LQTISVIKTKIADLDANADAAEKEELIERQETLSGELCFVPLFDMFCFFFSGSLLFL